MERFRLGVTYDSQTACFSDRALSQRNIFFISLFVCIVNIFLILLIIYG